MNTKTKRESLNRNLLIKDIATSIMKEAECSHKPVFFVSISGGTSTCKSSLVATSLQKLIGENGCELVHLDNFQKGKKTKSLYRGEFGHDTPDYFESGESHRLLKKLKQQKVITIPKYDFRLGEQIGYSLAYPKPIVIIEGLFASHGDMLDLTDYNIYVQSPCYARMLRRMIRNSYERYNVDPSITLQNFPSTVNSHIKLISQQKHNADACITIPYRFDQSLARFRLGPVHNSIERFNYSETILSYFIDDKSYFSFKQINGNHYFILNYNGLNYFEVKLKKSSSKQLINLDFGKM